MDDDLQKRLKARLAAPLPPALDQVRSFLLHYVHDSDRELLERDLRGLMKINPRIVTDVVLAIEEVLMAPQPAGTLYEIVAYEGNHMLGDETDETAAAWLKDLSVQLREWLGEYAPAIGAQ